ncbi:MAG: hypothetical protein WCT29_02565 [Candidatus Paceibacterota bacterium]|jgi:hypothetical protein
MINLIPNHEKKKKVRDFYFRFTAVLLAVLGFCGVAGIVSLSPAYFLSEIKKNIASTSLETQKNEPATNEDKSLSTAVADLKKKLTIVENSRKDRYEVSRKVINEVTLRKMPDIKITHIIYERDTDTGPQVNVLGVAPSRERLLLFRRALEDAGTWKVVDLPISNFVKGSNIEFHLTLTPS